jgi:PD-(D/E)XK nuclease superfamily
MDGNQLPPRLSFSKINPRLQLAHDSTSIKAGKKCWRYYEYNILEGYVPKNRAISEAMVDDELEPDPNQAIIIDSPFQANAHIIFGWMFAAAIELYNQEIARGTDHQTAQLAGLEALIINTYDYLNKKPWTSDIPTKCRNTLFRTFILYTDRYEHSNLETVILSNGKAAAELSFRFEPGIKTISTNEDILLCGHIDVIKNWNVEDWILDQKTTRFMLDDKYFAQYNPDVQVLNYTLAGKLAFHREVRGFIIDAMQVLVGGTRFRRREIVVSEENLEEFLLMLRRYIRDLESCIADNFFPQNPEACGFGGLQCRYRDVCSAPPEARQELLDNYYYKRVWDPLQPR